MLLVHSRATSNKGGRAICNMNNHPFVSLDRRIGMVHNGTIEEIDFLKDKYQTLSDTDSECLLRIYEHGFDNQDFIIPNVPEEVSLRMSGIRDIWSYISTGAMAVALGERHDDNRRGLFLFRNDKRPLWLADLRNLLGQIFFFSSPEIWYNAINENSYLKKECWHNQKLIEMPHNQAWYFEINENEKTVSENNIFRFKLEVKSTGIEFKQGEYKKIKPSQVNLKVITNLDDDEEPPKLQKIQLPPVKDQGYEENLWQDEDRDIPQWNSFEPVNRNDHDEICKRIIQITQTINTVADNMSMEGSLRASDYSDFIDSLEQTLKELEGTLQILQG